MMFSAGALGAAGVRALSRVAKGWRSKCSTSSCSKRGFDLLKQQIKFSGPLTVAEYMKQCLLNSVFGYYMQGDVFGASGDFITSPEISQVFGELIAVWVLADWKSRGETTPIQLVELGPGRGTLLKDVLRVFKHEKFRSILQGMSIHLVEASTSLSAVQERTLSTTPSHTPESHAPESHAPAYKTSQVDGMDFFWYHQLKEVPKGHTYLIAHEFLDALPVHQFQMTSSGWREVLVDLDPTENKLRFVLCPMATPASSVYTAGHMKEEGAWLEVCPQGLVCAQEIGERVTKHGGAALIADYGSNTGYTNSLRAFRQHRQCDVLEPPGTADLTADLNFQALADVAAAQGAGVFGPMPQSEFLHKLGIRQRIEGLMKEGSSEQAQDLVSSYQMLTSPEHMGERFKFLAITSSPTHLPMPFSEISNMSETLR